MAGNENGSDGRLMIPVEARQKTECDLIGITTEQHNQILELADKIKVKGMGDQYDVLIKAITRPVEDLSRLKPIRERFGQ